MKIGIDIKQIVIKVCIGLLIIIGATPFLFVIGFVGILLYEHAEIHNDIPNFYKESGFKGQVNVVDESEGLSTHYHYTYEEEIDGKIEKFNFYYYGGFEGKAKDFQKPKVLAENFRNDMVSIFFKESFQRSKHFQDSSKKIEEELNKVGVQVESIVLEWNYDLSDKEEKNIMMELEQDIILNNRQEDSPLRGIWILDSLKYISLEAYQIEVIMDSSDSWVDLMALDYSSFPDGRYYFNWGYVDSENRDVVFRIRQGKIVILEHY